MTTINPYLTFNSKCEKAFNFYKSVFGGEFIYVGRYKDIPENPECKIAEEDKEKIMHIALPISKETILMGSDSSMAFGNDIIEGNNNSISVNTDTVEEVTRIFNELSEGGVVRIPLDKTFWGAYFGMFTDKFGIHWMVNCELDEHKDH
jgi:PhnB protein